jgi:hypothetical protein
MKYLQLQIKSMDQKSTLLAKRVVGLSPNEPREDNREVHVKTMNPPLA